MNISKTQVQKALPTTLHQTLTLVILTKQIVDLFNSSIVNHGEY